MMSSRASWMWSIAVMVAAIALVASLFAATFHRASGETDEPTYYACLFAGSLSQVGTTPPLSCGRGEMISWNSPPSEEPVAEPAADPLKVFWAFIDEEGDLGRNHGAVDVHLTSPGNITVSFEQDVTGCVYSATSSIEGMVAFDPAFPIVSPDSFDPTAVKVFLMAPGGGLSNALGFYLQVFCPGDAPDDVVT